MARVTIDDLPDKAGPIDTDDMLVISDSGVTKKVSAANATAIVTAALNAHIADAVDAHDASAVSVVPTGTIAATDVQGALIEVAGDAEMSLTGLTNHIADPTDAHDALAISFLPTGSISTTNVQDAVAEVSGDVTQTQSVLTAHITDPTDAHAASAISVVPFATIAATNVQDALAEVLAEGGGGGGGVTSVNGDPGPVVNLIASEVPFTPTGGVAATDVQAAIVEAAAESVSGIGTVSAEINSHLADPTDAHAASAIGFTPTGTIAATTAQAAIVEVSGDIDNHMSDPTNAHAASAIGFVPTGTIAASTVQAAIAEVASEAGVASSTTPTNVVGGSAVIGVGTTWARADHQHNVALASQTSVGIVELATAAETLTGSSTTLAVHPSGAKATYAPLNIVITADTGTTYTLVLSDAGGLVTLSDAAAIALTVPTNASVAFPVGTQIALQQLGAGQVTVGGGGITFQATPTLKTRAQFSVIQLIKVATDTWIVCGDLAAT